MDGDCALQPHEQVTTTKTGQTEIVLWTAPGTVHVRLPDGAQADWDHREVIWAEGFNPAGGS